MGDADPNPDGDNGAGVVVQIQRRTQRQKLLGFIPWTRQSDPYNQYLAYREGQAGWSRGSYQHKDWLMTVAKRVDGRARDWSAQLQSCEQDLDGRSWRFMG